MPFLPIKIKKFGFIEREKSNGKYVHNKCGRDFLYYCLHYYKPKKFNAKSFNHLDIEKNNLFGLKMPPYLAWTMLQFIKAPQFIKSQGLVLKINRERVSSFFSFLKAILTPHKYSVENAIKEIEKAVDKKYASGIDITLKYVFLNHVMFVYGYDKDNLYVFDTHQTELLRYKKMFKGKKYIMKLPKDVIRKHWSVFGRVWIVNKK